MKDGLNIFKGTIIKRQPVNKVGRPMKGMTSYFLVTEEKQFFIKELPSGIAIEKYVDQVVTVKGQQAFGLWDTNDPNVQSRVGDYIIIEAFVS